MQSTLSVFMDTATIWIPGGGPCSTLTRGGSGIPFTLRELTVINIQYPIPCNYVNLWHHVLYSSNCSNPNCLYFKKQNTLTKGKLYAFLCIVHS